MDLYEKSLNILELPAVLNMLSGEAVSQTAKEAAEGNNGCQAPDIA
jgi:hypothetical protein